MKKTNKTAWRIFRLGKQGPEVLFHAFEHNKKRTRTVPLDYVLKAEEKHVWNPGKKKGPGFTSGWHVVQSYDEAIKYLTRFRAKDLVVCRVFVDNFAPKPRSKVFLSKFMLVKSKDWNEAVKINETNNKNCRAN